MVYFLFIILTSAKLKFSKWNQQIPLPSQSEKLRFLSFYDNVRWPHNNVFCSNSAEISLVPMDHVLTMIAFWLDVILLYTVFTESGTSITQAYVTMVDHQIPWSNRVIHGHLFTWVHNHTTSSRGLSTVVDHQIPWSNTVNHGHLFTWVHNHTTSSRDLTTVVDHQIPWSNTVNHGHLFAWVHN